ncbi:hypothetical protein ACPPVW_04985 [Leifsonia sp. McL0607]|uniref:hypothetical protein n=1 Tax=Leifsonia sp. McL0607 TaxID=3415672 RepID=UPI003CF459B8
MNRTTEPDAKRPQENKAGLQRRTLIGAAAWAAPAIAATSASPAAASSVGLGVITFITKTATINGGSSLLILGTVVPATGGTLPSQLSLAYTGAVTGPETLTLSGGLFSFQLTAANPGANTPSTVTVSAPEYAPAEYTCTVVPAVVRGTIAMTTTPDAIPNGEQRVATGILKPPPGGTLPSTVTVTSGTPGVATVPATVPVAADGTFSIPVTAVASSGQATISVSASGFSVATFVVRAVAVTAETLTLSMPSAPMNTGRGLPMLDGSAVFTATLVRGGGGVGGGAVTFTAPAGTSFPGGVQTVTGTTDSSGKVSVTLISPAGSPAATKTLDAVAGSLSASRQFIVIGPVQTVGFAAPQITETTDWTVDGVEFPPYRQVPPRPVSAGTDVWRSDTNGDTGNLAPGYWLTGPKQASFLPIQLIWGTPQAGDGYAANLNRIVPARTWSFAFRNTNGGPINLTMRRLGAAGAGWTTRQSYPFTLT